MNYKLILSKLVFLLLNPVAITIIIYYTIMPFFEPILITVNP